MQILGHSDMTVYSFSSEATPFYLLDYVTRQYEIVICFLKNGSVTLWRVRTHFLFVGQGLRLTLRNTDFPNRTGHDILNMVAYMEEKDGSPLAEKCLLNTSITCSYPPIWKVRLKNSLESHWWQMHENSTLESVGNLICLSPQKLTVN